MMKFSLLFLSGETVKKQCFYLCFGVLSGAYLCWMSHKDPCFGVEVCFFEKVRKSRTVIEVKMCDEGEVNLIEVHFVEERKRRKARVGRMDAAVEHDALAFKTNETAGATNLTASSEGNHLNKKNIDVRKSTEKGNQKGL